jgi:hypothetical protein
MNAFLAWPLERSSYVIVLFNQLKVATPNSPRYPPDIEPPGPHTITIRRVATRARDGRRKADTKDADETGEEEG